MTTRIHIDVPATSANLGPGFDTLGVALALVDTITVEFDPIGDEVVLGDVTGTDIDLDPHDNLLCQAYRTWPPSGGKPMPGARFSLESRIPIGKGFGTSAASTVAGLAAGAFAAGEKNPHRQILRMASKMEGHPDNVAAAVLGGVTTAFCHDTDVHALNVVNHLTLGVGVFVPDKPLQTKEARATLPDIIPFEDAVFNVSRVSYLVTALVWGRWEEIGPAMDDRLHQPHRTHLIPALGPVMEAARNAGAYGAALSGGGPSVIALGPREHTARFTSAMQARAADLGWPGAAVVTEIRHTGYEVKEIV